MTVDVLIAEIGSTTTVVNAFTDLKADQPRFIGQGQAPTTVVEGDVNIGLTQAIECLKENLGVNELNYNEMLATSSAAGGLKMTVHGLVYDMTVRAAKEAALGAGANIHLVTAGKLRRSDLKNIKNIQPNIILIAGGVDYGERDTALHNAEKIADLDLNIPVIYAGNIQNHEDIREIFNEKGKEHLLNIVDNVYPGIDVLNVEPTRKVIQDVFEDHIIHAPGMNKVRELVGGSIMPTPGAVMEASILLKEDIGDLVTFDVGGATTDVHSVTEGSQMVNKILISPEPVVKRTVEGDLGVYINKNNIVEMIGITNLAKDLKLSKQEVRELIEQSRPIPVTDLQKLFIERLTLEAVITSVNRHAGGFRDLYSSLGKKTVAQGKDLTNVKWIIGTGGALTRLPNNIEILKQIAINNKGDKLLPGEDAQILIDHQYIMASLGVLSKNNKKAALQLLKESLGV